jgi:heme exporter protein B
MKDFFKVVFAIVWKDLLGERRTREILGAMLVFALIIVLIFAFAFNLSVESRRNAAAGVIWVTLCFAGTLSLNRTMSVEKDRDGMDGLLLAPIDRTAIYIGKVLVNWVYVVVVAAIIVPAYALFNSINLFSFGFLGVILFGTIGYILTGTMLSTLSLQLKTRDLLLPVLLFPVLIPLLLAVVNASTIILQGGNPSELRTWILLLLAYDLIFLAVSIMVFDKILEE